MKLKINRQAKTNLWLVTCSLCDEHNWISTWAAAKSHSVALSLVRWHLDEHARTQCPCCKRHEIVSRPKIIGPGEFSVGDRRFLISDDRVIEVELTPRSTPSPGNPAPAGPTRKA